MKIRITDPGIIRERERELFASMAEAVDWQALTDLLKQRHHLDDITVKSTGDGDMVAAWGGIAYQLNFDVEAVLSVAFDREGNYLEPEAAGENPLSFSGDGEMTPEPAGAEAAPINLPAGDADFLDDVEDDLPSDAEDSLFDDVEGDFPDDTGADLTLDEILAKRPDMIRDPMVERKPTPPDKPREKMARMASDLAEMISDINGNGRKK